LPKLPGYGFSDAKGQSSAGNGGANSKRVFGTQTG